MKKSRNMRKCGIKYQINLILKSYNNRKKNSCCKIDKNEVSDNGISEDEDLMMREVIQGDADYYVIL